MLRKVSILVGMLLCSVAANAATVFDVTGPAPFGFGNQAVLVMGWSLTGTYTNVTIVSPLRDDSSGGPIGGVEGVIYLVNHIGPGTTAANNVAPPVSVSGLTASFAPVTLFTALTLNPGNYYLVWVPTNTSPLSMSPEGSSSAVVTPGIGVVTLGGTSSLTPAPFPPATSLALNPPGNLFLTVTGTAGAGVVPTLSTWALMMLASALLFLGIKATR